MTVSDSYVLEQSDEEIDRLLFVSEFFAAAVEDVCRRAGVGRGGRVIDIGCGPLGALRTLAGIVGPEGTVVGLDADKRALDTARRALDRGGVSSVNLIHEDVNRLSAETAGRDDFDLAYCRLILMHQTDPAETMARIAGVLRPGGTLVAIDFFSPTVLEPDSPALNRAWELIISAMRARGATPETSRRYRAFSSLAGLEVESERGQFFPIPPYAAVMDSAVLLRGSRATVESAGIASAAEIDEILGALDPDRIPDGTVAFSPHTVELMARTRR